jgi:hypothetical protein
MICKLNLLLKTRLIKSLLIAHAAHIFITLATNCTHLYRAHHKLCTSLSRSPQTAHIFIKLTTNCAHLYDHHKLRTSLSNSPQTAHIFITLTTNCPHLYYDHKLRTSLSSSPQTAHIFITLTTNCTHLCHAVTLPAVQQHGMQCLSFACYFAFTALLRNAAHGVHV